jgi:hypothetical protein
MRYLAALIVGFWLLMLGLLIRLQIYPEGSDVLSVPPEHVIGLMFTHGQPSDLSIQTASGQRIGSVALRPSLLNDVGERSFGFTGNVQLQLPGIAKQRIVWESQTRLDAELAPLDSQVQLTMREPNYQLTVSVSPKEKIAHYELFSGANLVDASSVDLTEAGLEELLRRLGFDPTGLKALRTGSATPEVKAKRTKFSVRGEEIEAYRITLRQDDQIMAEAYVSQLGQVLILKTSLGFRLVQDDLFP